MTERKTEDPNGLLARRGDLVDPHGHGALFPVTPGVVRHGRERNRTLSVGQGFATQNGHPAQQFRAMLGSQVRISRQGQAKDVYLRVIDRFEAVDDRAAHQRHLATVPLDFLVCVDPVDRHRQVQLQDVSRLPNPFEVKGLLNEVTI